MTESNNTNQERLSAAAGLFFQESVCNHSLTGLAQGIYELFDRKVPVSIFGSLANVLVMCPNQPIGNPDWDHTFENKASDIEHFDRFYQKYEKSESWPILIEDGYLTETKELFSFLFHRNHLLGSTTFLIGDAEPDAETLSIIRLFNAAVRNELIFRQKSGVYRYHKDSDFLRLFLKKQKNGSSSDFPLDSLKVRFPGDYVMAEIRSIDHVPNSEILIRIANELADSIFRGLVTTFDNKVVLLCSFINDLSVDEMKQDMQSIVIDRVLHRFSHGNYRVAVSDRFSDIQDCYLYLQQAELVFQAGIRQHPDKEFYAFSQYAHQIQYAAILKHYPLRIFCPAKLIAMYQYDQEYHLDLAETFRIWILHQKNSGEVARMLNIHSNTIRYRLGKIKDLFEIDFNNDLEMNDYYSFFLLLEAGGHSLDDVMLS